VYPALKENIMLRYARVLFVTQGHVIMRKNYFSCPRRPKQYGWHGTCSWEVSKYATESTRACCPLHIRSYILFVFSSDTNNVLVPLETLSVVRNGKLQTCIHI
jgi:hypothetical protein